MSRTSRPGRAFTAFFLAALALWPLAVLGSRCAACPQPRAAAPCCHPSAQAPGQGTGAWVSGCCEKLASSATRPAREAALAPGAPAAVVLPTDGAPVPVLETVSGRLPVRLDPRRSIPLYTLFSVFLI